MRTLHRDRLLGISTQPKKDILNRFYSFIKSPPSSTWVDIWRSIPWQDYEKWQLAANNPIEEAHKSGKI